MKQKITEFNFKIGKRLFDKYEVVEKLGVGWEGEVYQVREVNTKIERAAKLFFPSRNVKGKTAQFYAKKLHKLSKCSILIRYHNEETFFIDGNPVTILISEFVEGQLLTQFVRQFPGKRLKPYIAFQLLYALVKGIEEIHLLNEYHGDLHMDNVIVSHFGLRFELKLLDMYHWGASTKANRQFDIVSICQLFHELLGGSKYYSQQPKEVKEVCCGLKPSLILKKFPTITHLKKYLEQVQFDSTVVR